MNPAFLLFSALLLSPPAMAVSWHPLRTSTQMTLEADAPQMEATDKKTEDKEKKKDKKLKIWNKITYSQPQQANPGDFYYSSSKTLSEINCTIRSHKPLQKIYYGDDAREAKNIHYGDSEKAATIIPDSQEEAVFDFACNYNPSKTTVQAAAPQKSPVKPKPLAATKPAAKAVKPETAKEKTPKEQAPKAASGAKAPAGKSSSATQPAKLAPTTKPAPH